MIVMLGMAIWTPVAGTPRKVSPCLPDKRALSCLDAESQCVVLPTCHTPGPRRRLCDGKTVAERGCSVMPGDGLGQLTTAVITLAAGAERSRDPQLARAGSRCARRLRSPLRIALVGRAKTGKSTLLNALLGTAVAPTDAGECTKVVHQFRHDQYTTASLVTRNGRPPVRVRFTGSRLPTQLELPASEIRYVDVTLPVRMLRRATLIDTPGLASSDAGISAAAARMMDDTNDSAAHADALLYCVRDELQQDEAAAVRDFRRGTGARRLSAVTAIGVLTQADKFRGDLSTAWPRAVEMASAMSQLHADLFAAVVPVVGLLAETAATGALRERHAHALGQLTTAWSSEVWRFALADPEVFLTEEGPVSAEMRHELLGLLGVYGIGEAVTALRRGASAEATTLAEVAVAASGITEVHRQLAASLSGHADLLKAAGALDELLSAAQLAGDTTLRDAAQQMLDEPTMFPLQVLEMAQSLAAGEVLLPPRLLDQVRCVVHTGLPPASPADADRAVGEWHMWAQLTDANGRRIAQVMVRAWQLAASKEP
jgi:hypothetical protein